MFPDRCRTGFGQVFGHAPNGFGDRGFAMVYKCVGGSKLEKRFGQPVLFFKFGVGCVWFPMKKRAVARFPVGGAS
eukprot:10697016-Alexandrium_andersonii.AAC.1